MLLKNNLWVSVALQPRQLLVIFNPFHLSHFWWMWRSICSLYFLANLWIWASFPMLICHLDIFFVKFLILVFFFYRSYWFLGILNIFEIWVVCQIQVLQLSSPTVGFAFMLLILSSHEQRSLLLMQSNLIIFYSTRYQILIWSTLIRTV